MADYKSLIRYANMWSDPGVDHSWMIQQWIFSFPVLKIGNLDNNQQRI